MTLLSRSLPTPDLSTSQSDELAWSGVPTRKLLQARGCALIVHLPGWQHSGCARRMKTKQPIVADLEYEHKGQRSVRLLPSPHFRRDAYFYLAP
jgi:hypothetical protein